MRRWYIGISLLVAILLTTACITASPTAPLTGKLEVLRHSMSRGESGGVQVQVTVKNVGSTVVELAQVRVNFSDAQGKLVDSSSDAVMNLRPDESWDFVITCTIPGCEQVENYEIETMAGTSSGGL